MLRVRTIQDLNLPELQPYLTMRRQMEHRQQGIFVAEGEKVVRRLLESRFETVSALMPERWLRELEPVIAARKETVEVFLAEKKLLERLTGFSMYQGLLAVGKVPTQPSLEELLQNSARPCLFVAADGLSSAENLGVLVRNSAAFSASALLVGESCASPFLRRAVRSSMGAIFHLPVTESASLAEALGSLRRNGIRCIAAHPHTDKKTLPEADLRGDCCIVFGSEGYGISAPVLQKCDDAVAIPMALTVDSLNVASAAAVFLYEANRQRRLGRLGQ